MGLLCSYSGEKSQIQLSFCERTSQSSTTANYYTFNYHDSVTNSDEDVVVNSIAWLNGISLNDMFHASFVDHMRRSNDKTHFEMYGDKRQFLAVIAAISMTGESSGVWCATRCEVQG